MALNAPALTSPGLGSGLDVKGLVSQLMAVESKPLDVLNKREASYQSQISAYGLIKNTLFSLQSAAQTLSISSTFSALQANTVDASIYGATVSGSASPGSYAIEVKNLARSQKLVTTGSPDFASSASTVGNGTITLNFGTYSVSSGETVFTANPDKPAKLITIDTAHDALSGVCDAINAANAGVTASIVNDDATNHLVLNSNDTGLRNVLKIGVSEGDVAGLSKLAYDPTTTGGVVTHPNNMAQNVAPTDAKVIVDGIEVNKPSNTIDDAIEGVTFNLQKTSATGVSTQLTVARTGGNAAGAIQAFVNAYNAANKQIGDAMAYDHATGKSSPLTGDTTARNVQIRLRRALTDAVAGVTGNIATLYDIGVSFQRDGTLKIDGAKLNAALADPNKDVAKLFTSAVGTKGYGMRLNDVIGGFINSRGLLPNRTGSLNSSIKNIGKQRAALQIRLDAAQNVIRNSSMRWINSSRA